jgi:hypothetical protein
MSEYPKMLYRPGGPDDLWGNPATQLIVEDSEGEKDARVDGFGTAVEVAAAFDAEADEPETPKRRGRPPKAS